MEDLQDSNDRYKAIFDLCDDDHDGYIDVDHFKELAKDHFGAEGLELEVSEWDYGVSRPSKVTECQFQLTVLNVIDHKGQSGVL